MEVLICLSLIFSDVDIFSCVCFFKQYELNLLIQVGFLNKYSKHLPRFKYFSDDLPKDIS